WWYAYGQKKTHLLGQADEISANKNLNITFANNYYYDSMDRMPRLRYGTAHVYNCIMDSQELYDARLSITNKEAAKHIVSNGASSTCNGHLLLQNCYINGIMNALNSGNGSSDSGYINAVNSLYYVSGTRYKLEPKTNSTYPDVQLKIEDESSFVSSLPYSGYALYDAAKLSTEVKPYTGAGKLNLTVLQWEKQGYIDETWSVPEDSSDYTNDGLPEIQIPEENNGSDAADDNDDDTDSDNNQDKDPGLAAVTEGGVTIVDTASIDAKADKGIVITNKERTRIISDIKTSFIKMTEKSSREEEIMSAIRKFNKFNGTNYMTYDISLVDMQGDEINFANGYITVKLPYPNGTDGNNYKFEVFHLADTGLEQLEYLSTDEGLVIKVSSFSPFAVIYYANDGSNTSGGTGISSMDTGDKAPITVLVFIAVFALCMIGCTCVVGKRRKCK
ncbi:MAG: hypothetical protein PUE71_01540, partial [Clostridia bacterium]|nr:hypothetical protein [Clostridia bacterium]